MVEFIDSCRMCLESRGEFFSLDCNSLSPDTSILEAYNFCTGLNADLNDSLPNVICSDCANNLIFAFKVIQKAIRSDELLRQIIKKDGQKFALHEEEEGEDQQEPVDDPAEDSNQPLYDEENDDTTKEEQPHDDDIDIPSYEFDFEIEQGDRNSSRGEKSEDEYSQDTFERNEMTCEATSFPTDDLPEQNDKSLTNPIPEDERSNAQKTISPAKTKTWCCELCGKLFGTKQKLSQHNLVHTKEKNFPCPLCPKRYATIFRYRNHMKTHENIRNFECKYCQQRFFSRSALVCHLRRHTGERPYKCEVCGKTFNQASIMKTHAALHTGKTVECKLCSKKFSRPSHLKLHERSHTGERPYICTHCPNRYRQKSHLDRHLDTHLGIKHTCEVCGKSYTTKSSLNHHKLVHTATNLLNCEECKLEFTSKEKYNRHLKNVHKSPKTDEPTSKDSHPIEETL